MMLTLLAAAALADDGATEMSLAQTRQVEKIEGQLAYYRDAAKSACGVEITVDWASFIAADRFDGPASAVASACQGGLQGLAETCADERARAALGKKAKSVVCLHVESKSKTGLGVYEGRFEIRVHIMDTGAGAAPTSLMAPNRTEALGWLEKHL